MAERDGMGGGRGEGTEVREGMEGEGEGKV